MAVYKYKATPTFRQRLNTTQVMDRITLCLLIVYTVGVFNASTYGLNYAAHSINMLLVALLGGVGCEVVYASVIKKDPVEYVKKSFPWITCLILVEIIPFNTSLFVVFAASIMAIFFGKLAFGGLGQNIFNPAAVGRAIITQGFAVVATSELMTCATPLTSANSASWIMNPNTFNAFLDQFGGLQSLVLGTYHGALGETSILLLIALFVFLAIDGVVDLMVPLTYLTICFIGSSIIGFKTGLGLSYPVAFICTGGIAFASVFMLTDPVTSPMTVPGRMVFAAVAAFITCLIRFLSEMPEGVTYGILIANMLAPLIDKLFSNKQTDDYARNNAITWIIIILVIVAISAIGLSIQA